MAHADQACHPGRGRWDGGRQRVLGRRPEQVLLAFHVHVVERAGALHPGSRLHAASALSLRFSSHRCSEFGNLLKEFYFPARGGVPSSHPASVFFLSFCSQTALERMAFKLRGEEQQRRLAVLGLFHRDAGRRRHRPSPPSLAARARSPPRAAGARRLWSRPRARALRRRRPQPPRRRLLSP